MSLERKNKRFLFTLGMLASFAHFSMADDLFDEYKDSPKDELIENEALFKKITEYRPDPDGEDRPKRMIWKLEVIVARMELDLEIRKKLKKALRDEIRGQDSQLEALDNEIKAIDNRLRQLEQIQKDIVKKMT